MSNSNAQSLSIAVRNHRRRQRQDQRQSALEVSGLTPLRICRRRWLTGPEFLSRKSATTAIKVFSAV
jgi:hypothetical protein